MKGETIGAHLSRVAARSIEAERRRGVEIMRSCRAKVPAQRAGASIEADNILADNSIEAVGCGSSGYRPRYLHNQRSRRNQKKHTTSETTQSQAVGDET